MPTEAKRRWWSLQNLLEVLQKDQGEWGLGKCSLYWPQDPWRSESKNFRDRSVTRKPKLLSLGKERMVMEWSHLHLVLLQHAERAWKTKGWWGGKQGWSEDKTVVCRMHLKTETSRILELLELLGNKTSKKKQTNKQKKQNTEGVKK